MQDDEPLDEKMKVFGDYVAKRQREYAAAYHREELPVMIKEVVTAVLASGLPVNKPEKEHRGAPFLIPISFAVSLLIGGWGLSWTWGNVTQAYREKIDRIEKTMWTKAAQRQWETDIRAKNAALSIPKTSEVLKEIDPE